MAKFEMAEIWHLLMGIILAIWIFQQLYILAGVKAKR